MNAPRPLRGTLFLAAALAVGAFWGVLTLTDPPGPGLDPDALSYMGAGLSLARGEGLRVPSAGWASADTSAPLVHFPPGFPAAISIGVAAGASPVNSARIVMALAAAVTIFTVVITAGAAAGIAGGITVAAMVLATPALMFVHGSVLSEPLFLALLALFVSQLARNRAGRETRRAVALGAIAAAATLVRYAGVSLVAAVVLDALIFDLYGSTMSWRERIRRTLTAAALPVVALGTWTLTRPRDVGAEKIREVGIYTAGWGSTLFGGATTVARWLAPAIVSHRAVVVVGLIVLTGLVALFVRLVLITRLVSVSSDAPRPLALPAIVRLQRAVALVAPCYLAVLFASRLLADPGIPLDDRLLSPLFLLAALAIGSALAAWWHAAFTAARHTAARRVAAILTIGITIAWVGGAAYDSAEIVRSYREDGGDLASREWRRSPVMDWAVHAPPGARLYSNWPAAIWFHTGRAAFELPGALDAATVAAFRDRLAREHGAVLAFSPFNEDMASPDSLAMLAGLVPAVRAPDGGTVWRVPADTVVPRPLAPGPSP